MKELCYKVATLLSATDTYFKHESIKVFKPLLRHTSAITTVILPLISVQVKKRKVRPRTGHKGPEGEHRYSCTLSSTEVKTSVLDGGRWLTPRPGHSTLRKETRYPSYRRLCGLQGRSGRVRKTRPRRCSIPGPSSPQRVATPTETSRSTK